MAVERYISRMEWPLLGREVFGQRLNSPVLVPELRDGSLCSRWSLSLARDLGSFTGARVPCH